VSQMQATRLQRFAGALTIDEMTRRRQPRRLPIDEHSPSARAIRWQAARHYGQDFEAFARTELDRLHGKPRGQAIIGLFANRPKLVSAPIESVGEVIPLFPKAGPKPTHAELIAAAHPAIMKLFLGDGEIVDDDFAPIKADLYDELIAAAQTHKLEAWGQAIPPQAWIADPLPAFFTLKWLCRHLDWMCGQHLNAGRAHLPQLWQEFSAYVDGRFPSGASNHWRCNQALQDILAGHQEAHRILEIERMKPSYLLEAARSQPEAGTRRQRLKFLDWVRHDIISKREEEIVDPFERVIWLSAHFDGKNVEIEIALRRAWQEFKTQTSAANENP
jgi:hypothetical protein